MLPLASPTEGLISFVRMSLLRAGSKVTRMRVDCREDAASDHSGEILGCFFLTSRRMALEMIIFVPLLVAAGSVLVRRWLRTHKVQRNEPVPGPLKLYVTFHCILSCWYKAQRELGWGFLFMPCLLLTAGRFEAEFFWVHCWVTLYWVTLCCCSDQYWPSHRSTHAI